MKTIRLLYPDHVSGGLDTYYFGANLLSHILPRNDRQPLIKVDIEPPDGKNKHVTDGIYAKEQVLSGIVSAQKILAAQNPDRVITIGGNCLVSLAPFDYLHGLYPSCGIVWIDAHPDVSTTADGYPYAHAMVLGTLLGSGDASLAATMRNPPFSSSDILYVGLQELHDYQRNYLDTVKVNYKVQTKEFISSSEISAFLKRFSRILVHLDVDVLDEHFFHSTYFANPQLVGDGAGGGRMTMEKLSEILRLVANESNIAGFTIAEYLPFDEHRLHKMLANIKLFTE